MAFDNSGKIFNASACGDNCAPWICKIAKSKDLTINLHHIMDFSRVPDFKAFIIFETKSDCLHVAGVSMDYPIQK